jgi:ribokinase
MTGPVVVVGQVARDLAVRIEQVPAAGRTVDVLTRREMLGGKGANIAVGLAQLGVEVTLIAVVGDDLVGEQLLEQCARDAIDVRAVLRRPATESALMIDIVTADGRWRYLESVPAGTLLSPADVLVAADVLRRADTVIVQLQQPAAAALAALQQAGPGCRVVLDGVPEADDETRRRLLRSATVLRCDAREAELIARRPIPDPAAARAVARELLDAGPSLVVLAVGDEGNLAVWADGETLAPLIEESEVVDTTGGGDAFVAALTWSLIGGADPDHAVRLATAAAGLTVGRVGGRPALNADRVRRLAAHGAARRER